MDISHIHSTYTDKTRYIAEFLATNGRAHGCHASLLERPDSNEINWADRAVPNDTKQQKGTRRPRRKSYLLKLGSFVPLSLFLANKLTPKVEIPSSLIFAVNQVIRLRSQCNDFHTSGQIGTGKEAEAHRHPIRIFQQVKEILDPLVCAPDPSPFCGVRASATMQGRFAALSMDDDDDDEDDDEAAELTMTH